jgi:hypothetical protein
VGIRRGLSVAEIKPFRAVACVPASAAATHPSQHKRQAGAHRPQPSSPSSPRTRNVCITHCPECGGLSVVVRGCLGGGQAGRCSLASSTQLVVALGVHQRLLIALGVHLREAPQVLTKSPEHRTSLTSPLGQCRHPPPRIAQPRKMQGAETNGATSHSCTHSPPPLDTHTFN